VSPFSPSGDASASSGRPLGKRRQWERRGRLTRNTGHPVESGRPLSHLLDRSAPIPPGIFPRLLLSVSFRDSRAPCGPHGAFRTRSTSALIRPGGTLMTRAISLHDVSKAYTRGVRVVDMDWPVCC